MRLSWRSLSGGQHATSPSPRPSITSSVTRTPTTSPRATCDEIEDPQDLSIRCILNDEVMQDGTTSKMIFSVAELVSFLSQGMTLVPGDIIVTGTPPGVGSAR